MRVGSFVLVSSLAVLFGCGGGGGGNSGGSSGAGGGGSPLSLEGNAVKGYLVGATVNLYGLNANGTKGSIVLGAATTDAKGKFTVSLTPAPSGAFQAETSGGFYTDEVSGATITLNFADHLCAVLPAGTVRATVTPITNVACLRAMALAASGVPLDDAVASSNTSVAQQFNLADIITTLPVAANNAADVATAVRDERNYGIVLAGLAQEAASLGVRAVDLGHAFADDLSDGTLDGKKGAAPITIPNSAVLLSASAGTGGLQSAINAFIASANNQTHITAAAVSSVPLPVGINTAGRLYTTTTVLPAWISGQSGSVTLTAKGGTPPYKCSLKTGSLPVGLSLSPNCVLSGTVSLLPSGTTMSISAPFTVTVTDSATPPVAVDQELHVTITAPKPTLTVTPATCAVSAPCSVSVAQASGGTPPYSFRSDSFAGGAPPLGMAVSLNGSLTGTPSQAGVYNFGVCAVDLVGSSMCAQTSVTVNATLTVNIAGTGSGTVSRSSPGPNYPGTTVTLTATPATGSTFAGWSGACTGTGSCVVTMTTNKTVTATFNGTPASSSFNGLWSLWGTEVTPFAGSTFQFDFNVNNGVVSYPAGSRLNNGTLTSSGALNINAGSNPNASAVISTSIIGHLNSSGSGSGTFVVNGTSYGVESGTWTVKNFFP